MAWEDRDYNRGGGSVLGGRLGKRSVVTWLLVLNIAVFIWDTIFAPSSRGSAMAVEQYAYFSYESAIGRWQVWRFFTFQFIHYDFFHLLFNLIALYFFGPMMEQWWGSRRFVVFYLLCGISGAGVYLLLATVPGLLPGGLDARLIGASGGVFGILTGCAVIAPRQTVQLLFPPIPLQIRTLVLVFLGIAVVKVLVGHANAGGEAAHLGGAALGFGLVKLPRVLDWADRVSPAALEHNVNAGRYQRKRKQEVDREAELDRILIKVKEHGLHALTRKEKKTLQQATDARRG